MSRVLRVRAPMKSKEECGVACRMTYPGFLKISINFMRACRVRTYCTTFHDPHPYPLSSSLRPPFFCSSAIRSRRSKLEAAAHDFELILQRQLDLVRITTHDFRGTYGMIIKKTCDMKEHRNPVTTYNAPSQSNRKNHPYLYLLCKPNAHQLQTTS